MRRVFSRPGYLLGTFVMAGVIVTLIIWLQNASLITHIALDPDISATSATGLILSLSWGAFEDASLPAKAYMILLASAVATNMVLLLFYYRMHRSAPSLFSITGNLTGIVFASLGFGCAACGSVFVTALFATVGGTGLIALMPLHGMEVGILGIVLLILSAWHLSSSIQRPPTCPI